MHTATRVVFPSALAPMIVSSSMPGPPFTQCQDPRMLCEVVSIHVPSSAPFYTANDVHLNISLHFSISILCSWLVNPTSGYSDCTMVTQGSITGTCTCILPPAVIPETDYTLLPGLFSGHRLRRNSDCTGPCCARARGIGECENGLQCCDRLYLRVLG